MRTWPVASRQSSFGRLGELTTDDTDRHRTGSEDGGRNLGPQTTNDAGVDGRGIVGIRDPIIRAPGENGRGVEAMAGQETSDARAES
jgi:hypothetical protein